MIKQLLLKSVVFLFLIGIYLAHSNSNVYSEYEQDVVEASMELQFAYSELSKGETDEAIVSFNKAISLDDKNSLAYTGLGNAYVQKGNFDEAIVSFNKAISLDDKNSLACTGLGKAYSRKGNFDEAIVSFNKAISLDDKNSLSYTGLG
ncbi:MAG: tetratricopeptide repeat protein [Candidatus Omnitrophica bacterium]|nr:tetratricopeptide repeat protein [Candidatus Omnitrophota bacterium]